MNEHEHEDGTDTDTDNTGIDIIWLKRDVRLTDHGPFSTIAKEYSHSHSYQSTSTTRPQPRPRPLIILCNYEPDQLSEHSVHGSHVSFVNEGLIDLDRQLSSRSSSSLRSRSGIQFGT